jgi:DNA-binding transcriptional regulator YiaG
MSVVDWTEAPGPWRYLGPEIADTLRRISAGEDGPGAPPKTDGQRIREARLGLGLTVADVTHAAGLKSRDLVYRWERGYCTITPQYRKALSSVLGISL